ncbi:hypothetical protein FNO01nite_01400 [Flavobacterium noncentrifugens]|uniref:DUF4249 domain-containing protein n=1 Tax=Flavobacterium noncentrifugens TaxID=1128970 RepID=A0A1G8RK28_9FLAO|nr:DUF4249 domain-containing protein [Flavobacterium noncentrifugens]GEP49468.1 hypothetical protein FNO01nite_01400 [Flavobacterium noncentrifugens]SDJ17316.1 protein of unknown function [Flavobacterium noncentrifugens]
MKSAILKNTVFLIFLSQVFSGCTEPYALQTNTFDDMLVVEATITNEMKQQQVKLTRTFRFEDSAPQIETGANVYVTDEENHSYEFDENNGVYLSREAFQAIPGKVYRLNITTSDGKSYNSSSETLTTANQIQDVSVKVATKDGQRGVQINVKTFDPTNSSKYYRYEYDETYKIIAPKWANLNAVLLPPTAPGEHEGIALVPRNPDTQICYSTKSSNDILQTTTTDLSEDRTDFMIRFISSEDYIISHRYSILVRQYVQNLASYEFYKTLKELSGAGSVLSQNQPGFFYGNIKSTNNPDEKVIGFFEVASVASKRIFFNYADLFPGEELPPYYVQCDNVKFLYCFEPIDPECRGATLITNIRYNWLVYYSGSMPSYTFVPPPCGDCTLFSSNVIPPFWE